MEKTETNIIINILTGNFEQNIGLLDRNKRLSEIISKLAPEINLWKWATCCHIWIYLNIDAHTKKTNKIFFKSY